LLFRPFFMTTAFAEIELDWAFIRRFLPFDLDGLALESGALKRRRGVGDGERLLRTFLLWGQPNASIARSAAQAKRLNLANLSGPALHGRLEHSEKFLSEIFCQLIVHGGDRVENWKGFKLVDVDATALCGPGAKGTDQRLHVAYDLGSGRPLQVDLTGPEGGETFRRFLGFGPGVLILGDQGYGHGPGIVPLLQSGAGVLVRFNFYSIRLLDSGGLKITPEQADSMLKTGETIEFEATLPGWDHPVRIFGARNPEGKGVWLLTDLPQAKLAASEVRSVYSRRWQIENFFKRMKSLSGLDGLPTRDGPTARPWVWIKLILATLAALIGHERFSPWGYPECQETAPAKTGARATALARRRGRPRKSGQEEKVPTEDKPMGRVCPSASGDPTNTTPARKNHRTTSSQKERQKALLS
jgi:hypothetical protein